MSEVQSKPTLAVALEMIAELTERVAKLEATPTKTQASIREMTDDDARRILTGNLAQASHKLAAEELGLSYGQVYSCRLEYTFKHIHKDMREAGLKNAWAK